jgi:hypothetical protein
MRRAATIALASIPTLFVLASPARSAECVIYRNNIDFKNEMEVRMLATTGKDCRVHFPLKDKTVIDVNQIIVHPYYGGVRVDGVSGASYRSNPGYRGPDHFAFSFCGREAGAPGCARVRVKVEVR